MFELKIELGNDSMRNAHGVALALEGVVFRLRDGETVGKIRDLNGNTVGEWELTK